MSLTPHATVDPQSGLGLASSTMGFVSVVLVLSVVVIAIFQGWLERRGERRSKP
jgi:hypothetical protein